MVALRPKASAEEDVTFKGGFTIHADKSPNSRGAREVLEGLGLSVVEASDIWTGIREGRIRALYLLGGDPQEQLSEAEREERARLVEAAGLLRGSQPTPMVLGAYGGVGGGAGMGFTELRYDDAR